MTPEINKVDVELNRLGVPTYSELFYQLLRLNNSVSIWIGEEADGLYDSTKDMIGRVRNAVYSNKQV